MNLLFVYYLKNKEFNSSSKYLLEHISKYVSDICVVTNNSIDEILLSNKISKKLHSDRIGSLDGYNCAVSAYSRDELLKYDRIIFSNSDLFGPIVEPKNFFSKLIAEKNDVFYLENVYSSAISHYLFSLRPENLKYKLEDIISKKAPLKYACFYEEQESRESMISNITKHITKENSPFIFKEILTTNPVQLIQNSLGLEPLEIMNYVKNETVYPVDYIWEDLIRTTPMSILRNNFHQTYILPSAIKKTTKNTNHQAKIALVCYIYYEYLIPHCYKYALSMPKYADIYIITSSDEMSKSCQKAFSKFPCKKVFIRQMENRGRDVAAYLVAARSVFYDYDYVCCVHDKKSPQYTEAVSRDFNFHLFESNLKSPEYVHNIITTFQENPKLGMLIPPFPLFGGGLQTVGNQMHIEGDKVKRLLSKLNFSVPFDLDVCAPLGTMFWVRGKAFLPIFRYDWKHTDFPPEPNKSFGTILHGIERFYPFAVQEAGYLVGTVSPIEYTKVYLDNMYWIAKVKIQDGIRARGQSVKKIHFKDVKKIAKEYLLQKIKKFSKPKKKNDCIVATIKHIEKQGNFLKLHLYAPIDNYVLSCNHGKYLPEKYEKETDELLNSVYEHYKCKYLVYSVPLKENHKLSITLSTYDGKRCALRWESGKVIYSALSLKMYNIFLRITKGKLHVENKRKFVLSVLTSNKYSLMDKIIYIFLSLNFIHKNIIFSENHNATDNAFELFLYSLKRNKNSYFIVSKYIRDQISDKKVKKNVLVYNSFRHIWKVIFSKLWITSYTLTEELFPKTKLLKDIHYQCIPSKWIFVPHGMLGDKTCGLVHRYVWDEPFKTYVSSNFERMAYIKNGFHNVVVSGYPRMDKWSNCTLDNNKIVIFFTWRMKWIQQISEKDFISSNYYETVISIVEMIRKNFPNKHVYYVFHHEVEKSGLDKIIKNKLGTTGISYVYFSTKKGGDEFNNAFKSAKYLITDYSSVAYDFGYAKGKIPIYYLRPEFIDGHYPLTDEFYKVHLGTIVSTLEELKKQLKTTKEPADSAKRRLNFFSYLDGKNSERVYNSIMEDNN